MYLLLAFLLIPVLEIAAFIQVGAWIGLWPTVGLVVLTAIAGTALLRLQGLAVLRRAQEALARNELPVGEVFDGFCLLIAGVLLLTPGFVTDTLGLLLFLPPLRARLGRLILTALARRGGLRVFVDGAEIRPRRSSGRPTPPGVIDGEFREVGPVPDELPPTESRWRTPPSDPRP